MIYILENDKIKIEVNSLGAELLSLYNKENAKEYLWHGDKEFWNRRSPVLFPNVGKYYDSKFRVNGLEFTQKQHGFARDKEFVLEEESPNSLLFRLDYDEETLKVYPFKFSLYLSYELNDNVVDLTYIVKNLDDKVIYYQIGGHPAFMLLDDENYFNFGNLDYLVVSKICPEGYASGVRCRQDLSNGYLKIQDELFLDDAMVIENKQTSFVKICDKNKKEYLDVSFDCPLYGLWNPKPKAPFVCIEPWWGRCDQIGFNGDISNRDYINKLEIDNYKEHHIKIKIS